MADQLGSCFVPEERDDGGLSENKCRKLQSILQEISNEIGCGCFVVSGISEKIK